MRPPGAPGLVAALRERVPPRVQRKLEDGNPAEAWTWSPGQVQTDGDAVVGLPTEGPVGPDDLRCSCLLAPRCLHVLAVALALPAPDGGVAVPEPVAAPERPAEPQVALDGGQRAVAGQLTRVASDLVVAGAQGFGPASLEGLRRGVHGARSVGLPRLGRAGARVLRGVRDLQRERPEFSLDALVEDLRELLAVGRQCGGATAPASAVGTARAQYVPVGSLRIRGLCTEPVIASTGHAGVVTWLADERMRVWSISDVLPGGPDRARAHYDAAAGVGGSTMPHRELGRAGLFLQDASASSAGRIGTGGGVRAARANGGSWDAAPLAALWGGSFAERADRARDGLLFVDGVLVGSHRDAVVIQTDGGPFRLVAPSDHVELAWHDNLRMLARAVGASVRLVARRAAGRRALVPLAFSPLGSPDPVGFTLPEAWGGRCNVGLDRLVGAHAVGLAVRAPELTWDDELPDPLAGLRRRVARMALGGRRTLPGEARGEVEREARILRGVLLQSAAGSLLALADATGHRSVDAGAVGAAWLRAAVVVAEAGAHLER